MSIKPTMPFQPKSGPSTHPDEAKYPVCYSNGKCPFTKGDKKFALKQAIRGLEKQAIETVGGLKKATIVPQQGAAASTEAEAALIASRGYFMQQPMYQQPVQLINAIDVRMAFPPLQDEDDFAKFAQERSADGIPKLEGDKGEAGAASLGKLKAHWDKKLALDFTAYKEAVASSVEGGGAGAAAHSTDRRAAPYSDDKRETPPSSGGSVEFI